MSHNLTEVREQRRTSIRWVVGDGVFVCRVEPGACPLCGALDAVVQLPPPVLAEQPDETTHVCHPSLGGCNVGYARSSSAPAGSTPAR